MIVAHEMENLADCCGPACLRIALTLRLQRTESYGQYYESFFE